MTVAQLRATRQRCDAQQQLDRIDDAPSAGARHATGRHDDEVRLRRAVLDHKRATVLQLRDDGVIDDIVLRRIQAQYDVEELRLSPTQPGD